jgi:hypothetical protein
MVEFPPYIKILPGNAARRLTGAGARSSPLKGSRALEPPAATSANLGLVTGPGEVVNLVYRENQASASSQVPSASEAAEALRRLEEDLPSLGESVGEIHSNLNRHRILDLLAPLLDS